MPKVNKSKNYLKEGVMTQKEIDALLGAIRHLPEKNGSEVQVKKSMLNVNHKVEEEVEWMSFRLKKIATQLVDIVFTTEDKKVIDNLRYVINDLIEMYAESIEIEE